MREGLMRRRAQRLSSLALSALLLSGGAVVASAADDKRPALDCKLGFDAIREAAYARPGTEKSEKPDWDMVKVKSAGAGDKAWWLALFVFTQKQHYAYLTVTLKSIWKEPDGKVLSERTACGYGDKALFDKVMAEFAELDRQMNEAIAKEHPEKPKQ
jgi:hypothetical protein